MAEKLRILLIGAKGTLGSAVVAELGERHQVISAGRHAADVILDLADPASIEAALQKVGEIDAVACAAGEVSFAPLAEIQAKKFSESVYTLGLSNKLLGQINLALAARKYLRDRGSITLISGILCDQPVANGSSASMVNGAVNSFVIAAAIEMPRGLRINAVCPTVLQESMPLYAPAFRGFAAVPAARAALAYSRSIEGLQTGQIYKVC